MVSLLVETDDLAAAARGVQRETMDPLFGSYSRLWNVLVESGAMAGDDPGGLAWASAYDTAAQSAFAAYIDLLNGWSRIASMFVATARNYEAAETASTAAGGHRPDPIRMPHVDEYGPVLPLHSAAGGSGGAPHGWGIVEHLVGYIWPNGHQDRLRRAAAAWRASAAHLTERSEWLPTAMISVIGDRLPECDDMCRVCWAMNHRMSRLAAVHAELGGACEQLAAHIDEVHGAITGELWDLAEWTAGIEVGGALLSLFSFGASEGAAQAAESARVAKTAATIAALMERFIAAARTLAASIIALAERADAIAAELIGVRQVRLSYAVVSSVKALPPTVKIRELAAMNRLSEAARGLPALTVSVPILQKKFKHAADFGVLLRSSKPGWEAFDRAVTSFVTDARTTRVAAARARYRDEPAILNYNAKSRLVVIQHPSGTLWSCWRMSEEQLFNVRKFGILSRG